MSSLAARIDTGACVSFIASAVIHLAVFLLLAWYGELFPLQIAIQETYYVDVVNLPVADPQSGATGQKGSEGGGAVVPVAPPPPMKVPSPATAAQKSPVKKAGPTVPLDAAETESAFTERMAKLERSNDVRREEAVLEKLRMKVKVGSAKVATPGAAGSEAGSQYADFIKSRLEDALKVTSSYSSKNPEVSVRLTISAEGKLVRMKVERSSGDATFELAVRRAIDLASEKFTAPPGRTMFENGFVFRPKGIFSRISR
jgi:colicin import membrane protein